MFNGFWSNRKHHLDKMTLGELTAAYFQYPAVQVYLGLLVVSTFLALWLGKAGLQERILPLIAVVIVAMAVYPLVWYLLHRFVLHGRFLYRSPRFAALWKRIHFDHHQDPNDLRVLFGALHTTLPTIALVTLPIGWLISGTYGAFAALGAGMLTTLFYEYCHCIQHLRYQPRSRFFKRIKRLHLLHHFHNENGNYGITNFFWDRVTGTYYDNANVVPHSETVFNLGYTDEEVNRYPWVAELSRQTE